MSGFQVRPTIVVHADWGTNPSKQWMAMATRTDRGYVAAAPEPVGRAETLIDRVNERARDQGPAMIGFDFPIGLPRAYAERAGIDDFRALLHYLGNEPWHEFHLPAATLAEISIHRPFYPRRPGGTSPAHLVQALGVSGINQLRRLCELPSNGRPAAAPIFWTLGGNQVGKAALSGWRSVLVPSLQHSQRLIRLWPFDGSCEEILGQGNVNVVVETYPREFYDHLGVRFPAPRAGTKSGKCVQGDRAQQGKELVKWADRICVGLSDGLRDQILDGFGAKSSGEDAFDAVVGLFGILNVVLGARELFEPQDLALQMIEGWIFGQQP